MTRFVSEYGRDAPTIPMQQSLEVPIVYDDSQPYNGFPTSLFPFDYFDWGYFSKLDSNATEDASQGIIVYDLETPILGETKLQSFPSSLYNFPININDESQGIIQKYQQQNPAYGIPELVYNDLDENNEPYIALKTCRTTLNSNAAFHDEACAELGNFVVDSYDPATLEIRVKGNSYYQKDTNSDSTQVAGTSYRGLYKYFRDVLSSETTIEQNRRLPIKYDVFSYGLIRVGGVLIRYDRVIDENNDPTTDADPVDTGINVTYHKIRLTETPVTTPVADDLVTLYRRLPFIAGMISSAGTFSQGGGYMMEVDVLFPAINRQFSSVFLWSHYWQSFENNVYFSENARSREIDVLEQVSGEPRWTFHNFHDIRYDGVNLNMDVKENRVPMVSSPEWDSGLSQQSQMSGEIGGDYAGQRVKIRTYVYGPDGDSYGAQPNSAETYVEVDGVFKRVAATLLPATWSVDAGVAGGGECHAKKIYITAAAMGSFWSGLSSEYGLPATNNPDADEWITRVYGLRCFTMPGYACGGAGWPDETGVQANWYPTPGDLANSGSGVVRADGRSADGLIAPIITTSGAASTVPAPEPPKVTESTTLDLPIVTYLANPLNTSNQIKTVIQSIVTDLGTFDPVSNDDRDSKEIINYLLSLLEQAAKNGD